MYNSVLLLLCCILGICRYTSGLSCNKISSCGCELEDGSARVDLTPITKLKDIPMFKPVFDKQQLYVDLCRNFDCSQTPSHVCLEEKVISIKTNISYGQDLSFHYNDQSKIVTFIYSTPNNVQTRVILHCTDTDGIGSLSINNAGQSLITMTLTSKYACWHHSESGSKKSLSTGSILCITLLVLVVVYVVGGILINKYVRKVGERDGDLFPNKKMWTGLPSLVKDGFKFTYSKIRRGNEEYQPI